MKALRFDRTGSLSALTLDDVPLPALADGEVRVQVRAAGINPSDAKNVLGRFPYTTLPRTPGRDFAGVVVDGPEALRGREVWGSGKELGFTRDGSHAEYVTLPAAGVAPKPKSLSFAQAASCGVPYVTAWDALKRAGVTRGTKTALLGLGAVGRAALDLAAQAGADVLCVVRREEQAAQLRAEGRRVAVADAATLEARVRESFAEGAEVIFDTTGFLMAPSVFALATYGRIAVIAAPPPHGNAEVPILPLYRRGGTIVGVNSLLFDTVGCAKILAELGALFDSGAIPAPTGVRTRPLTAGLEAYAEVDRGSPEKIVLTA